MCETEVCKHPQASSNQTDSFLYSIIKLKVIHRGIVEAPKCLLIAFRMTRRFSGAHLTDPRCQKGMLLADTPGARIAGANQQEAMRSGWESKILE